MRRVPAILTTLVVAAAAASASAAPVDDRVLGEVAQPVDVATDGTVTAWTHGVGARTELVIHRGGRVVRRATIGGDPSIAIAPVDVGRDAQGRVIVVTATCRENCSLRAYPAGTGAPRTVTRLKGRGLSDLAVRNGRVIYATTDSPKLLELPVTGGTPTLAMRSTVGPFNHVSTGADGVIVATTISTQNFDDSAKTQPEGEGFALLVGRGRGPAARLLARSRREPLSDPLWLGGAVAALRNRNVDSDGEVIAPADALLSVRAGRHTASALGSEVLHADAGRGRVAYVTSPVGGSVCRYEDEDGNIVVDGRCRIVLAAPPSTERRLPPTIHITGRTAALVRPVVGSGRVLRLERIRQAGVAVVVSSRDGRTRMTSVTGPDGTVQLAPTIGEEPPIITAATQPRAFALDLGG